MLRFPIDYPNQSRAEPWFFLAQAYSDCCGQLLSQMVLQTFDSNFYNILVTVMLQNQALELFLKAGIIQATGQLGEDTGHDLQLLHNRFKNLYPGKEYKFPDNTIDVIIGSELGSNNQYPRYPENRSGEPWLPAFIDLIALRDRHSVLHREFARLKPLLEQRYPPSSRQSD